MAKSTAKHALARKGALWLLVAALVAGGMLVFVNRTTIGGYAEVGTAYAARVGCSCRFVAGRSLESCEGDKVPGMEVVTLSEDIEAKSVTAAFPLVTSTTATFREGYGCVLERWDG